MERTFNSITTASTMPSERVLINTVPWHPLRMAAA